MKDMARGIYAIEDIFDYKDKLSEQQKKVLVRHCNRYEIRPDICAWYDDWEDFCSDWCDYIGYTKTEARKLLHSDTGEFCIFGSGEIVRLRQ